MESSKQIQGYPYEFIESNPDALDDYKFKVSAISAYDNILALGTENGYLYSYEIVQAGNNYTFEKNSDGSKRGNDKIVKLQIIPALYNITLCVDKNFFMVSMENLSTRQEIKTKEIKNNVYNYAIKKSNTNKIDMLDIYISLAIATSKGYIYLWVFNQDFKFEEDRTTTTGEIKKFSVGDKVYAIEWIDDSIYIGTRNSYFIISSKSGGMKDIKVSPPFKEPQIAIFREDKVFLL